LIVIAEVIEDNHRMVCVQGDYELWMYRKRTHKGHTWWHLSRSFWLYKYL